MATLQERLDRVASDLRTIRAFYLDLQESAEDYMRSLNGLVRSNKGAFKSEKQASFLFKSLLPFARSSSSDPIVAAYKTKHWSGHPKDAIAAVLVAPDPRFKEFGPTKRRHYGQIYVIDGGGVVATAKLKMKHPTVGDPNLSLTNVDREIFKRTGEVPILFNYRGEFEEQIEKAKAGRESELYKKIEAVKKEFDQALNDDLYKYKGIEVDFATDFLGSLQDQVLKGRDLSPKQLRLLNSMFKINVSEGESSDWEKIFQEGISALTPYAETFMKYLQRHPEFVERGGATFREILPAFKTEWNKLKTKPRRTSCYDESVGAGVAEFNDTLMEYIPATQRLLGCGPFEVLAQTFHAAAKGPKKATKKSLGYIGVAKKWAEILNSKNVSAYKSAMDKLYEV